MLKSFRDTLLTTAMATTPFLLTACGDDPKSGQTKFEVVVLVLLCYTMSAARSWLKTRRIDTAQPAA
jgi:hypothetical protein